MIRNKLFFTLHKKQNKTVDVWADNYVLFKMSQKVFSFYPVAVVSCCLPIWVSCYNVLNIIAEHQGIDLFIVAGIVVSGAISQNCYCLSSKNSLLSQKWNSVFHETQTYHSRTLSALAA